MSTLPNQNEILAEWRYTPSEWQTFVEFEEAEFRKYIRSTVIGFIVVALVALLLMACLLLIPLAIMNTGWRPDVYGPPVGVAIVAAIILATIGLYLLVSRGRIVRLSQAPATATIRLNGLRLSGGWFGWGFEPLGWRFGSAKRRWVDGRLGSRIEVLEFRCIHRTEGRTAIRNLPKVERVPIPAGKTAEADSVIARLMAERERSITN